MQLFGKKNVLSLNLRKRDLPNGLWLKCTGCNEIIFRKELDTNHGVCPKCDFHFHLPRRSWIDLLIEDGKFEEWDEKLQSVDTLKFTGVDSYADKLKSNMKKTGERDAVTTGQGTMGPHEVGFGIMDFKFLGASMGSVVGEKITRLFERSTEGRMPVVLICASGGARMYEGMLSLMQMAKTSAAVSRHARAGLPYIPVLTHPTMAGVMASFATQGNVIIGEPGALIGFAGPRVIKETTNAALPDGFQTAEFLLDRGLLDQVCHRHKLKSTLISLLSYMDGSKHK